MKPAFIVILFLGFMVSTSCENEEISPSPLAHVYLAGSEGGRLVYWNNGKMHTLSESSGTVIGMSKTGGDVYMGGSTNEFPGKLVIWVNGKPKHFYDTEPNAHYTNFVKVNGDVYFSGYIDSLIQTESNVVQRQIAVYWKNDEKFVLSEYEYIIDMKVAGSDVYMVTSNPGPFGNSDWALWKNGTLLTAEHDYHSIFMSLAVDKHDVYGVYRHYGTYQIWKDGETTELVMSNPSVKFWSVTAHRGAFYLAGARVDSYPEITFYTPAYWKREENRMDEQTLLPFAINTESVSCDYVLALGDDIYAIGSDNGPYPTEHILFWINSQLIYPFDGTNSTFRWHRFFVF